MNTTELKAKAARYMKIVEWSDEDGCFVGTCPGLMFGGVHGDPVILAGRSARTHGRHCWWQKHHDDQFFK